MLLAASVDGAISVCETAARGLMYTLKCHTAAMYSARWPVDGTGFSSAGVDNRVVLWDEPVIDYIPPVPELVNGTKPRSPERRRLTRFNEPIPREEPLPPQPGVATHKPLRGDREDAMRRYVRMMHSVTDQIANLLKMVAKIEARMNVIDEQIAIVEVQKRRQAKRVLKARGA